jgi:hypothetical protein
MANTVPFLKRSITRYAASLSEKSYVITRFLDRRMGLIGLAWLVIVTPLAAWRLATPAAPIHKLADASTELLGYGLVIIAPIIGFMLARAASRSTAMNAQTHFRFALLGRWQKLAPVEAQALPAYGVFGFMASLLVGLLLNVVIRTVEFFTAVPAMGAHAPYWGRALFALMSADVVITGFLYMVAFVMALRAIPLFPRMLGFVWLLDITMQMFIAQQIGQIPGVPANVTGPLVDLLQDNITKVLISILVWLPYLLLSERVNVTYRHRTQSALPQNSRAGD